MLYKNYIVKGDLIAEINATNLEELIEGDDNNWIKTEKKALEAAAAHTRHYYDTDTEFREVTLHDASKVYTENQRVYVIDSGEYKLYVALKDVPATTVITDETYWEQKDDRNALLVSIIVDKMIYSLTGRNRSGDSPGYWFDRNKDANAELVKIQKGITSLDIPLLTYADDETEQEDPGQAISWGERSTADNNTY